MASPAQLMQTISEATGVPLATIVDIDRRLVKAGLRTKGGRGLHAARMTPLDAARLLTGVLASPQANVAVEAVERYAATRIDISRSSEGLFDQTGLDDLIRLPGRHGFVDALATLIASAAAGSLKRVFSATRKKERPHIEVFAFTRATWGRIRLSAQTNEVIASVEYRRVLAARRTARRGADLGGIGDLEQSRRITDRTLLPIAELLREET